MFKQTLQNGFLCSSSSSRSSSSSSSTKHDNNAVDMVQTAHNVTYGIYIKSLRVKCTYRAVTYIYEGRVNLAAMYKVIVIVAKSVPGL